MLLESYQNDLSREGLSAISTHKGLYVEILQKFKHMVDHMSTASTG